MLHELQENLRITATLETNANNESLKIYEFVTVIHCLTSEFG